jgi:intracellular sulfur oxidation DsrE/DsrF family protein
MSDSSKTKFSDEFLNAFVDGQLTPDEQSRALVEISQDENVNRQVCELRKVRDLVQLAYAELPVPPRDTLHTGARHWLGLGLAASVALAIGIAVGWTLHQPTSVESPTARPVEIHTIHAQSVPTTLASVAARTPAAPPPRAAGPDFAKVLIHVNDDDTQLLAQTLDEVENLLEHYRAQRQQALVEVVINGPGLALVRQDVTRFAERIHQLQEEYDNVTFAACQNTIDRLRREKGITARLLPGVVVIDSGMAQLMRRQNQGWVYIQG